MDIFVRRINLDLYEREFSPLASAAGPERRGFVNELAFNLFAETAALNTLAFDDAMSGKAILAAQEMVARIEGIDRNEISTPTEDEWADAQEQLNRLHNFFGRAHRGQRLQIHPRFPGCGIIDTCEGDVYCDGVLYEIKAGDRKFRSIDLRQLLIYAALNDAAKSRELQTLGLFNPRTGTSYVGDVDTICFEVSGRSGTDFLAELTRFISSGDVSR